MIPPFFAQVSGEAAIQNSFGAKPRIYPLEAPEKTAVPYAVYDVVSAPENYINQIPDIEQYTLEVFIYARTVDNLTEVAEDLQNIIETFAQIISKSTLGKDKDTKLYGYSIVFDWWYSR